MKCKTPIRPVFQEQSVNASPFTLNISRVIYVVKVSKYTFGVLSFVFVMSTSGFQATSMILTMNPYTIRLIDINVMVTAFPTVLLM